MTVRFVLTSRADSPCLIPVRPKTSSRFGAVAPARWKLKRTPGGLSRDSPAQRVPRLGQSRCASTAPASVARKYPSPDARHTVARALPGAAGGAALPSAVTAHSAANIKARLRKIGIICSYGATPAADFRPWPQLERLFTDGAEAKPAQCHRDRR